MTRVLALDLAGNAGWSVVSDAGVLCCGSWHLAEGIRTVATKTIPAVPVNSRHVLQMQRLRKRIADVVAAYAVDFVVVEREFGTGIGAVHLTRLQGAAHEAAHDAGVASVDVRVSDWRTRIHSKGYDNRTEWLKAAALRLCADRDLAVPDADAAEAVLIGLDAVAYGLEALRADEATTKKSVERKAVKARKAARQAAREAKKAAASTAPKRRRAA